MRKKKIKKSQQNVETWVMSLKGTRHTGLTQFRSDLDTLRFRFVSLSSKLPDMRKLFRHMQINYFFWKLPFQGCDLLSETSPTLAKLCHLRGAGSGTWQAPEFTKVQRDVLLIFPAIPRPLSCCSQWKRHVCLELFENVSCFYGHRII